LPPTETSWKVDVTTDPQELTQANTAAWVEAVRQVLVDEEWRFSGIGFMDP
jgi:hypothetical protein